MNDIAVQPFIFSALANVAECPYCGHGNVGLEELGLQDGETTVLKCDGCGSAFEVLAKATLNYGSRIASNRRTRLEASEGGF